MAPERQISEIFTGKYRKNQKITGINGKNGHDKKAHAYDAAQKTDFLRMMVLASAPIFSTGWFCRMYLL